VPVDELLTVFSLPIPRHHIVYIRFQNFEVTTSVFHFMKHCSFQKEGKVCQLTYVRKSSKQALNPQRRIKTILTIF